MGRQAYAQGIKTKPEGNETKNVAISKNEALQNEHKNKKRTLTKLTTTPTNQ